jgi:hypothetical protein
MVFGFGKAVSQAGSGRSVEHVDSIYFQSLASGLILASALP